MPPPECKVCRNNYNDSENLPLLLPCFRTLCRSCVRRVFTAGRSIKCPVCFGKHDSVNLEKLMVNYDLLETSVPPSFEPETEASKSQVGTISLVLTTLDGKKYSLKVFASATIREVKEVIKNQYGFDNTTTRLLFSGRTLKDNHTLTYYGVKKGSTLQMITNYLGGYLLRTIVTNSLLIMARL